MDLLKLAAKIELDDSSYTKGISNAEKAGQALQGKMSAMTVAVGNLAADMISKGFSAITGVIGGAVDSFADYEQLVGGVETLFKESSGKVEKYAKNSFKTTGLSANQYMETVTGFSASLLQGLDGNTELAADIANLAITDMADNANKMGTDISSIQNAYAGFAKQNYTMLDNLKLGYGGTASEMVRLVNDSGILEEEIEDLDGITFDQLILAIHQIQTQMDITGTTAKEAASTISGSKASLAAAWQDLLSAVGGEGGQARLDEALENFKSSFTQYMENFIPSLVTSIGNSGELVKAIGEAISGLPSDMLRQIAEAGFSAGTDVMSGLTSITGWLIDSIAGVFRGISANPSQLEDFAHSIGEFIGSTLLEIAKNVPTFVTGLFDAGVAIAKGLIDGLIDGISGQQAEVDHITDVLTESLTNIEFDNTRAGALISYMESLVQKYGSAASETEEWRAAQEELEQVLPGAGKVFEEYGKDIEGALLKLTSLNQEMRQAAIVNALTKAANDELELLATQQLGYEKQRAVYNRESYTRDNIRSELIGQIQSAAQAKIAEMDEAGGPVGMGQQDYYNKLVSLSEGFSHVGDRMTELEDLDFDELNQALQFLGSELSPETLEGMKQAYTDADLKAQEAKAAMDASLAEIDATKQSILDTNEAMGAAVEALMDVMGDESETIETGTASVGTALQALADTINSWGEGGNPPGHAAGIDYVPYDNYRAVLHRGERVLTAAENKTLNSGGSADMSGLGDMITAAIKAGMEGATVNSYMDGTLVSGQVSRVFAGQLNDRRYL